MASALENLVDMGFDKERAELAVKHGGDCKALRILQPNKDTDHLLVQGAIEWLDKNQERGMDELTAQAAATEEDEDGPALQPGEEAKSLICNDCGKKFRSTAQAEFHAGKTQHTNFAESTEEIAPLTEDEKRAKLEELRLRLAEKRKGATEQDKIDQKRNEQIRLKATKEQSDAKEELAKKEQIKEAQAKRREKQADIDAKKRIQARIAADKEERKLKSERDRAARAGQSLAAEPPLAAEATPAATASTAAPKPASAYTEARLRLQTPAGTVQRNFPAETTLFEVAHAVSEENGVQATSFQSNFPRKTFVASDFGMTLKEAGFVPSAALIVR